MKERGSATLTLYVSGAMAVLIVVMGFSIWALRSDREAQKTKIEQLEKDIKRVTETNEDNERLAKLATDNYETIKQERIKLAEENEELRKTKAKTVASLPKPLPHSESAPLSPAEEENSKQRIEALWGLYCTQSPTAARCRGEKP